MTEAKYHELMHRTYRAVRRRVTLRSPDHPDLDFVVLQTFRREVALLRLTPPPLELEEAA